MPTTPVLKFGVAGVGVMGRNHARVASEMREFDLTTVFDPDAVVADGVAAAYEAAPVTTAQAFVDAGLDAAVVATPNRFHAEIGVALLEKGVHVLVEKPITISAKAADNMINAAKKRGVFLMVEQTQRFDPIHQAAKKFIDSGKLGKINMIRGRIGHAGPEYWSEGKAHWFYDKKKSGGGAMASQ